MSLSWAVEYIHVVIRSGAALQVALSYEYNAEVSPHFEEPVEVDDASIL
jgi:hypothetical protein